MQMSTNLLPDLSLGLEDTHVLITGGAGAIGVGVVRAFLAAGALVTALDIKPDPASDPAAAPDPDSTLTSGPNPTGPNPPPRPRHPNLLWIQADITSESQLESAFATATRHHGGRPVASCVALAAIDLSYLPHHDSLADMPLSQWRETHRVNVEGTFLTARTWLRGVRDHVGRNGNRDADADGSGKGKGQGRTGEGLRNVGLVIIGSEAAEIGVRGNADYSAGKSAVQAGLMHSLKDDVRKIHPRARVNVVAPGCVDTQAFRDECRRAEDPHGGDGDGDQGAQGDEYARYYRWRESQATTATAAPIPVDDVARAVLFLASERWSGSVTGQVVRVDGGKAGRVCWMPGEKEKEKKG